MLLVAVIFPGLALAQTTYLWDADFTTAGFQNGTNTWISGQSPASTSNWQVGTTQTAYVNSTTLSDISFSTGTNTGVTINTLTLGENVSARSISLGGSTNASIVIDPGSGPYTLTLGSGQAAGNIGTNAPTRSITVNAVIAGSSGLKTFNQGTVILTAANTYTGGTTITGNAGNNGGVSGILQIGNGGTTGSLGSGNITFALGSSQTLNSVLRFNRTDAITVSNDISSNATNKGIVQQSGTGTLILSGNNTAFTGIIRATAGVLVEGSANAFGTANVDLNGGVIGLGQGNFARTIGTGASQVQFTGTTTGFAAYGANRTVTLNSGASLASSVLPATLVLGATSSDSTVTLTNAITLGTALTVQTDNGSAAIGGELSGNLSGSFGLNKTGAGTLLLSGTNTLDGTLAIGTGSTNGGIVLVTSSAALGGAGGVLVASAGATTGSLRLDGSGGDITSSKGITLAGRSTTAAGLESVGGNNTLSGSVGLGGGGSNYDIDVSAGGLTLSNNVTANSGLRTLYVSGAGNTTLSGVVTQASPAAGTSELSLFKSGLGTLTLSGTNTYIGSTSVSAGTLFVNGNNSGATGAVSIASGATLGGTGTLGGATTISGTLSAATGSTTGALAFSNGLEIDGTYAWKINANSVASGFDAVNVTVGNIILGAASTFNIAALGGVDFTDSFWTGNHAWTVINNSGSGSITGTFLNSTGTISNAYGVFSLSYDPSAGGDVTLNWTATAVPEPSTYASLAGAIALCLVIVRRRASLR